MALFFVCKSCQEKLKVTTLDRPKKITCPKCRKTMFLPPAAPASNFPELPQSKGDRLPQPEPELLPALEPSEGIAPWEPSFPPEDLDKKKNKKKRKKKRPDKVLVLALVGGLVFLLSIVALAVFFLSSRNDPVPETVLAKEEKKEPEIPPLLQPPVKELPPETGKKDTPKAEPSPPANLDPSATKLSGEKLYQLAVKGVTYIAIYGGPGGKFVPNGSGFLVDRDRKYVITNYHVVREGKEAKVCFPVFKEGKLITEKKYYDESLEKGDHFISAKIIARNSKVDLALLELESLPPGVRTLRLSQKNPSPGQNAHSIGNPAGTNGIFLHTSGTVRQVNNFMAKYRDGQQVDFLSVETQLPTNAGDSGGPMLSDRCELIGVTQGGTEKFISRVIHLMSHTVAVTEVRAFLQAYYQSIGAEWKDPPMAIAEGPTNVPDCIAALQHADAKVRSQALATLADLGPDARPALPAIIKCLKDANPDVSHQARAALQDQEPLGSNEIPVLVAALKDESLVIKRYVVDSLSKLGPQAKDGAGALAEALFVNDAIFTRNAAQALGKIGPTARYVPVKDKGTVFQALVESLGHSDADMRKTVFQVLLAMGTPGAQDLPLLEKMVVDPKGASESRGYAAWGLKEMGLLAQKAAPNLAKVASEDPEPEVRALAVAALGAIGNKDESTIVALWKILGADAAPKVKARAAESLGILGSHLGDKVLPHLVKALGDSDGTVRAFSAQGLMAFGPAAKGAVPELTKLLQDQEELAKVNAARALGAIGPDAEKAIPALMAQLPAKGPARIAVVRALGLIGPPSEKAVVPLINAMESNDPVLSGEIIKAMAGIGNKAKKGLLKSIDRYNPAVRANCYRALAALPMFTEERDNLVSHLQIRLAPGARMEKDERVKQVIRDTIGKLRSLILPEPILPVMINKYYLLKNKKTGQFLDVEKQSVKSGAILALAPLDEKSHSQHWKIESKEGIFHIRNRSSRLLLSLLPNTETKASPLYQYRETGESEQRWRLAQQENNYFIYSAHSGYYNGELLTVSRHSDSALYLWPFLAEPGQMWELIEVK